MENDTHPKNKIILKLTFKDGSSARNVAVEKFSVENEDSPLAVKEVIYGYIHTGGESEVVSFPMSNIASIYCEAIG